MAFWNRKEERDLSIADPALAALFNFGLRSASGILVTEGNALGLSAVWRAVSLISGTLASLPLKGYTLVEDGTKERARTFLDNPAGPESMTPYEWKELVLVHLLLHGNAFLVHRRDQGGALVGLMPIHPSTVEVARDDSLPEGKLFRVSLEDNGIAELTARELLHVPALSTNGLRGLSPIQAARNSFGTSIAGEEAAGRLFASGALVSGMVTPDEDELTADEAKQIKEDLNQRVLGSQNAGQIAVINRMLKFTPWSLSALDAQFLESRAFQVEEIARWFGVAPHLLMQTEKQTSWGTGIEEQHRALGRHTLLPWAKRLEERLSTLLRPPKFEEFDFSGLERPTMKDEITLLIAQVNGGFLTLNEARKVRNLPPLPDGDTIRLPAGAGGQDLAEEEEEVEDG